VALRQKSNGSTAHSLVLLFPCNVTDTIIIYVEKEVNHDFVDASRTLNMNETIGFGTNVARFSTMDTGFMI